MDIRTHTEKLSEYAVVFKRNPPGVTFTVGVGKLAVAAENLAWADAEQFIAGLSAGLNATL